MLTRRCQAKAERLLGHFPILTILGARQVGKSTLAQQLGAGWLYLDLENPADAERLLGAPELFFADHPNGVILDEVQAYSEVFEILRGVVDQDRARKGRFILTGSSSFDLISKVSESFAGRVAIMELHPMSQGERMQRQRSRFSELFDQPVSEQSIDWLLSLKAAGSVSTIESREAMVRGGYPEPVLDGNVDYRLDWYENYFRTYIERDLLAQFPRLNLLKYRRVVGMLSHVSHTVINRSEIARSIEASEASVRDYLEVVEGTYFWRSLPAFQTSKIKTTLKLPKGHFRDTGLCCYLQNIRDSAALELFPRLGHLFEGFVIEEIIRELEAGTARQLRYSHFRSKAGGEIDLILEGSFGCLPVEVKYAAHTDARQVRSMQNFIELHRLPLGLVISHAPRPRRITPQIVELPVSCLWS